MGQGAARSGLLRGRGTLSPHVPRRRLGFLLHLVQRPVVHVDDERVLLGVGRVGRHVLGAGVNPPRSGSGVDDDGSHLGRRGRGARAARRAAALGIATGAALAVAVVVVVLFPAAADVHHVANGASLARRRVGRAAASSHAGAGAGLLASAMLVGAA